MEHIKTFESYQVDEGLKDWTKKAIISSAMATSLLGSPKQASGQIGHKIRDFVKSEISQKQGIDLPEVNKSPIQMDLDESDLNHLDKKLNKEGYKTIFIPIRDVRPGKYIMSTTISNTQSAAQLQTTQMMKGLKHGNVNHYVKDLGNGKIQMISISQILNK